MMSKTLAASLVLSAGVLGLSGCNQSAHTDSGGMAATKESVAEKTVRDFRSADPGISKFFDDCAGYAVFPTVSQGAAGVGAWAGDGVVFLKGGSSTGYCSVGGGSVGLQIGGQTFSEIIFFKDTAALEDFKRGNAEFDAKASAVAVKTGSAAKNAYSKGVAVFIGNQKGLMAEAAIGGQKFKYWPK